MIRFSFPFVFVSLICFALLCCSVQDYFQTSFNFAEEHYSRGNHQGELGEVRPRGKHRQIISRGVSYNTILTRQDISGVNRYQQVRNRCCDRD